MTIALLATEILSSKTYRNAAQTGNTENLRILLIQAMAEVYEKTKAGQVSIYGKHKHCTDPQIKGAMKDMKPPEHLYLDPRVFNLDLFDEMGLEKLELDPYYLK